MKDKELYNKRSDGNYKGYTKDGFFINKLQTNGFGNKILKNQTKDKYYCAKTINELKQIKEANFIGKGNYEHKNDASLEKGHTSTEQFAKLTNIGSKEYVSMLLKRANEPLKNYDKRAEGRKKRDYFLLNV